MHNRQSRDPRRSVPRESQQPPVRVPQKKKQKWVGWSTLIAIPLSAGLVVLLAALAQEGIWWAVALIIILGLAITLGVRHYRRRR